MIFLFIAAAVGLAFMLWDAFSSRQEKVVAEDMPLPPGGEGDHFDFGAENEDEYHFPGILDHGELPTAVELADRRGETPKR